MAFPQSDRTGPVPEHEHLTNHSEPIRLIIGPNHMKDAVHFPPRHYETLRIDVSTNCNIRCGYCQVGRGKNRIDHELAEAFFRNNVLSMQDCVVGCAMEPTIHTGLTAFMEMVHTVRPPAREFVLQTNGTLLHRHDHARMRDAGLNVLFLSIDSVNAETMRVLRDGTDVSKVLGNVDNVREAIPGIDLRFSTVVSRGNLADVEELVAFAAQTGVSQVWLREVVYDLGAPPSPDMTLGLDPGEFIELERQVRSRFAGARPELFFLSNTLIRDDVQSYGGSLSALRNADAASAPDLVGGRA